MQNNKNEESPVLLRVLCVLALIACLPVWVYISVNFVYWCVNAPEQVSETFGGAVLFYSAMAYVLVILLIDEVLKYRRRKKQK